MAADAIVVGSGPNGLAAAITLAKAGLTTVVREAQDTLGGGLRSAELTMPGFMHDVCSAVHPLALSSPFFRSLPLPDFGLDWIHPPAPLAHPLDGGIAAMLERRLDATATGLPPAATTGPAARALRAPLGRAGAGRPGVAAPSAPQPVPDGPLRTARDSDPPPHCEPFAWHRGSRAVRRQRRAFLPAARVRRRPAHSGCCCRSRGTRWVGRSRAADRSASPTRWRATSARSAGGRDRCAGRAPRRGAAGADRDARPRSAPGGPLAGDALPDGIGAPSCDTATAPLPSSWTGPWMGPCRGPHPSALAPRPCISAARSRRSPPRRPPMSAAPCTSGRSSCSCNPPCSTTRARRPASTPRGPTATCPTAGRRT